MGTDVPQPADDEFKRRLSWSPSGDAGRDHGPTSVPSRRRRPLQAPPPATVRAPDTDDGPAMFGDLQAELAELRGVLADMRDDLARTRTEVAAVATLFQELIGEAPVDAAEHPDRAGAELRRAVRVRLKPRTSGS